MGLFYKPRGLSVCILRVYVRICVFGCFLRFNYEFVEMATFRYTEGLYVFGDGAKYGHRAVFGYVAICGYGAMYVYACMRLSV